MHSTMRKALCAVIAVMMILALVPVASLAEQAINARTELRSAQRWNNVWDYLDAIEAQMKASGATPSEVTMAVYKAALTCPYIDAGSISDLDDNGFSFTTFGMHGGYDYKVRNIPHKPAVTAEVYEQIAEVYTASGKVVGTKNAPSSKNVLLVGPWYSQDSSFTDQYKTESSSLASFLGGSCTQLVNSNATGPSVASAHLNKAIIIYDSHGASYNSTSYLCLTTSTGLTTSDYNNGYAYNGGSWYGIDGRYVQNHIGGTMSNSMVWMAMCEGMKQSGGGKTGTGLLAAGAGVVYGYSQSVSFTGDYKYEAYFWTQMRNGATVAEAFASMTSKYGNWDPAYSSSSGAAWPIVMSSVDAYPSNPDSHQTVYSDWTMTGSGSSTVTISSVSVANVNVAVGGTASVVVTVSPSNADYSITSYSSSNTSVATVSSSGVVTGKAAGTATLTVKVKDNTSGTTYTKTATITVTAFTGYTLVSAPVSGGQYIIVSSGYAVGNTIYSNNHYLTSYAVTVNSDNTLTIPSSVTVNNILWTCGGNATSGWTFKNVGNSKYMGLDSSQYLYPSSTSVAWLYSGGDLNNQVDSDGYYYLSLGSSKAYFTTSKNTGNNIQFYQYVSGGTTPTAAPTAAPTATPKPTTAPTAAPTATPTAAPTAAPTTAPTGTYYTPTTTITTGVEYLIGYSDGTNVYLLMNYCPDTSNHYYYNSSSNYYGYAVRAVMSGNNVVGVDTTTMTSATLANVGWKFVSNGSYYKIQSTYNTSYYLRVYSSKSYADCYPASGTSYATKWQFTNNMLKYTVSSSVVKYMKFYSGAADDYGFFGAPTSGGSTIILYKKVG